MILNPNHYQGIRLDDAVNLSSLQVLLRAKKFFTKVPVTKEEYLEIQDIIPLGIKSEMEDGDLKCLCSELGLKLIHPRTLFLSCMKSPDPFLPFPLFAHGMDESGYYFGSRGYLMKVDVKDEQLVFEAKFRERPWPAGTTFACIRRHSRAA